MRISSNRSQTESNLRDEKRKTYMIDTRVTKCNEREEVVELLLFERVAPPFLKRKKKRMLAQIATTCIDWQLNPK